MNLKNPIYRKQSKSMTWKIKRKFKPVHFVGGGVKVKQQNMKHKIISGWKKNIKKKK